MYLRRLFQSLVALTVKEILSYIKVKCLMVHLVQIVPCSLHVAPFEERPSFHVVAALEALENHDVVPTSR